MCISIYIYKYIYRLLLSTSIYICIYASIYIYISTYASPYANANYTAIQKINASADPHRHWFANCVLGALVGPSNVVECSSQHPCCVLGTPRAPWSAQGPADGIWEARHLLPSNWGYLKLKNSCSRIYVYVDTVLARESTVISWEAGGGTGTR